MLVLLGVLFRFANLEGKPYWFDEAFTSLRISGYDEHADANPALYAGQPITIDDIQRFQWPAHEKSVLDTVRGLARKEPQWPPLYFVLVRAWVLRLGESLAVVRSLSAVFAVLALPALYWFCRELFEAPQAARLALGLYAVSPLFVHFAQEARAYSLWLALLFCASAALLRAMRQPALRNWVLYALAMLFALYTHSLSLLLLVMQGAYVLVMERLRLGRATVSFGLAAAAVLLGFAPWLAIILHRLDTVRTIGGHLLKSTSLSFLLKMWGLNTSRLLVAWNHAYDRWLVFLSIPLLALMVYALYTLWRHAPRHTSLYLLLLVVCPLLVFVLPDLILGGQRSIRDRYLLPTYAGLELALAYLLARQIEQPDRTRARPWQGLALLLLVCGLLTSAVSVQAPTWWGLSEVDADLVEILNETPHSLVITPMGLGVLAALSYEQDSSLQFLLTQEPESLTIPPGYDRIYVYQPSEALRQNLADRPGVALRLVYRKPRWDQTVYSLYELEQN